MTMPPRLRRFMLTVHVMCSVGWCGSVVVFLVLAILGLTSHDEQRVRSAYLVMAPAAWWVLVPLALASLVTGLIEGLGTTWGLLQHWWIVAKLALTLLSTMVLFAYMRTFDLMARVAADPSSPLATVKDPSPVLHGALALIVLLVVTALSIYKPLGRTPYGRRLDQMPSTTSPASTRFASMSGILLTAVIVVVLAMLLLHAVRGPLPRHRGAPASRGATGQQHSSSGEKGWSAAEVC
jgi:hypothetical protein